MNGSGSVGGRQPASVWSITPELQGYLLGLPCVCGGVVSNAELDWRSHMPHLNHVVTQSYPLHSHLPHPFLDSYM